MSSTLNPMSKTIRGLEIFAIIVSIIGWSYLIYYASTAENLTQSCSNMHGIALSDCNSKVLDLDEHGFLGFGLGLPFSFISVLIHTRYFE